MAVPIIRRTASSIVVFLSLGFFLLILVVTASANHGVFSVKYKYAGQKRTLPILKAHDSLRQLQILTGVDLPLGGSGRPDGVGSAFLCSVIFFFFPHVYLYACVCFIVHVCFGSSNWILDN